MEEGLVIFCSSGEDILLTSYIACWVLSTGGGGGEAFLTKCSAPPPPPPPKKKLSFSKTMIC